MTGSLGNIQAPGLYLRGRTRRNCVPQLAGTMLQILCEVLDAAQPEELLPNQIYDRTDQMDQKGCAQNLHQYQREGYCAWQERKPGIKTVFPCN